MTVYSADWVLPVEGEPIHDGAVVVEGTRLAAVGPAAELGAGERFEDAVIVPGFVNAHSHLEYVVYVGFGEGLPFAPWLGLHVERKARIGWEDTLAIARLGVAESLASGITTTADYSFAGAVAPAAAELGLRAIVYVEVFGDDPRLALQRFEEKRAVVEAADGVTLGVSPHAPYSCSLAVYDACAGLGVPLGTHLAESEAETNWLLHGDGPMRDVAHLLVGPLATTGVRALDGAGILGPDLIAAHCVHVDEEEIELLAERGVSVAHCPRSNGILGCGIAPLAALRARIPRVGLGTDSPASTPPIDMFEEMRTAVIAARARERRPDALSAADALELATLGAARALRLDAETGSLRPGKRADLAVVSLEGSAYVPWEDPAGAVVFGGSPDRILLTLVDGTERYRRGTTEWHELIAAARSARARLLGFAPAAARAP